MDTQVGDEGLIRRVVLDFMQMDQFAKDPFVVDKGEGIRLWDRNGKIYIDGLSGVFVVSLGHANQAIIGAMTKQLQELAFAPPLHGTNTRALELAALVFQMAPKGLNTVKFLSGGSEATEAAMKLTKQYQQQSGHPRRFKFIAKYGAYHGATAGALSATGGWERKSVFEPLVPGFIHVLPPYCYRCPYGQEYPNCGITCAKVVEKVIESEDPETVAGVIMEPISISSAGFVVPPAEFFAMLRETTARYGINLILDEIICGFGRLGTNFGADHYKVVPDILCCGKGMSSGYAPLAAIIIADHVQEVFYGRPGERKEFHHGHTYGGNPLACAAGVAALTQLIEGRVIAHAHETGAHLRARFEGMYERFPMIGEVRGAGMLQGVEFVKDRQTKEPFPHSARPGKVVEKEAKERGLILRCGNEFVALAPPLISTKADVDEMCNILEESMAAAQRVLMA
ncbi:MAG: aminotransferase family protein [Chloroflexota bacterium]